MRTERLGEVRVSTAEDFNGTDYFNLNFLNNRNLDDSLKVFTTFYI